ncbi:MAG: DUF6340 family protein [Tepidisphaeraceae bacterium]
MIRIAQVGVALLLGLSVLLPAGGCDKNKKTAQAQKARVKVQQDQASVPPDKFESSDDPPFSVETRFAAGQLAESTGDLEKAIAQYQEAIKIDPNHAGALFRIGAAYTQTKRYNEAIAIWQRYLKVTKNASAAYNNLAICYESAGRIDDAEQTYKAGVARDPDDSTCRVNYGLMLARQGRTDDATAQLATTLTPAEVQYNLGSVLEQAGKREEAKTRYRKALELDPKLGDARSRLAQLK